MAKARWQVWQRTEQQTEEQTGEESQREALVVAQVETRRGIRIGTQ
jgi:hypothetical protein